MTVARSGTVQRAYAAVLPQCCRCHSNVWCHSTEITTVHQNLEETSRRQCAVTQRTTHPCRPPHQQGLIIMVPCTSCTMYVMCYYIYCSTVYSTLYHCGYYNYIHMFYSSNLAVSHIICTSCRQCFKAIQSSMNLIIIFICTCTIVKFADSPRIIHHVRDVLLQYRVQCSSLNIAIFIKTIIKFIYVDYSTICRLSRVAWYIHIYRIIPTKRVF